MQVDDKLKKTLLLMLRSSMPGEVVAARDAMLRVAQSHHYGPHELTQAVIAVITVRDKTSRDAPNGQGEVHQMARYCWELFDKGGCHLTEREQGFVQDMMIVRYAISEKQMRWLSNIYARCSRRG